MNARELQKSQSPNCLVNGKYTAKTNIQKSQFLISSMNWKKLKEFQVEQHSKIPIFNLFLNWEKWKYSLRPKFKSRNFESIDELGVIS